MDGGKMAMTQCERIVQYLQDHERITPMEAFSQLGITKLATRVGEINRNTEHKIRKTPVRTKNKFGESITYMSYTLEV